MISLISQKAGRKSPRHAGDSELLFSGATAKRDARPRVHALSGVQGKNLLHPPDNSVRLLAGEQVL